MSRPAANLLVIKLRDIAAMQRLALPDPVPFVPAHDAERELLALAEQTLRIIRIAEVLSHSGRPVDLDGIQHQVGVLCAKALDLPPGQAGFAKLELRRLVERLDSLITIARENPA